MVQATNILDRPAQFQWDADSTCQSSNCRCTSEAMIAGFYKDTHISPNAMRHAMGYSGCGGTDAPHGEAGLKAYGIAASWGQLTTSQVINKLNQNIPLDLAVVYGKIPRDTKYIQDMGFYGLHSVVACKRAISGGTTYGLIVRDPDRWGTGKVDHVFWPDSIWIPAFAAAQYVCVWPNNPKAVASVPVIPVTSVVYPYNSYRVTTRYAVNAVVGLNQRPIPNGTSTIEVLRPDGFIFNSYLRTDKGGSYKGPTGVVSSSWVAFKSLDSKLHWFALSYLKVVI